jgi:hypothetical protein
VTSLKLGADAIVINLPSLLHLNSRCARFVPSISRKEQEFQTIPNKQIQKYAKSRRTRIYQYLHGLSLFGPLFPNSPLSQSTNLALLPNL